MQYAGIMTRIEQEQGCEAKLEVLDKRIARETPGAPGY